LNEVAKLLDLALDLHQHLLVLVQAKKSKHLTKAPFRGFQPSFEVVLLVATIMAPVEFKPGVMNVDVRFVVSVPNPFLDGAGSPPFPVVFLVCFETNHSRHALSHPATNWTLLVHQKHFVLGRTSNEFFQMLVIIGIGFLGQTQYL
jgi:hypothetical protein